MSDFVPDIPQFASVAGTADEKKYLDAQQAQYLALKKKYRMVMRNRAALFKNNIQSYLAKRPFKGDPQEKIYKKVFKDANFVAAYPDRYQVGGMDLPNVKTFMLHRPGDDPASCLLESVIAEFAQQNRKASTHFITGQDGRLIQMVDLNDIAWHTGNDGNHVSVGVEMEGAVGEPISEQNYRVVASLIARVSLLSAKLPIDEDHVIEHRRVLPKIKRDVGPPLQIKKLLALAKQLVQTYNVNDLFKQLSVGDAVQASMATITAMSTFGPLSAADIATLQAMANNTDSMLRSVSFATYSRSDLSDMAAQQSQGRAEAEARLLAFQNALAGLNAVAKPQTNVGGVLFDQGTGLYNDGKTQ